MNFKVIISFDPEYNGYVVDVPELEGCMSQGKTFDEAMTNVKDAIKNWIEVEKELGRELIRVNKEYYIGEVAI